MAHELGKRSAAAARPSLKALVQVNVGGEAQKAGCSAKELGALLEAVEAQPDLDLCGLMTVPPHTADPEGAAPYFRKLVELREAHGGAARLPQLSMGMTHDLEVAVRSGATWIRIGTAIFGARKAAP